MKKKPTKNKGGRPKGTTKDKVRNDLITESNTNKSLSESMAKYIKANSAGIGCPHLKEQKLSPIINKYLDDLNDVSVNYTKQQMVNDLIAILKSGSSHGASLLVELLGFNNASESFIINQVTYEDVECQEPVSKGKLDVKTGKYI